MSCYNWESGSIFIPTAQWAGFKKGIRDAVNSQIDKDFALVTRVFEETLKAGKIDILPHLKEGDSNDSYAQANASE